MRVLCFDIGGTNVKYGVIENEQFIEKGLFDTEAQLGKEVLDGKLVKIAKEMKEKFVAKTGGLICKDLKGLDGGEVLCSCPDCIGYAVEVVEEVLGL